jgi:glycosyltransferase AglD
MKSYSKETIVRYLPGVFILACFILLTSYFFDTELMCKSVKKLLDHPFLIGTIFGLYFVSFWLKAIVWKIYLGGKARVSSCLLGILYSLFVNHILPIKIGDLVRMKILSDRDKTVSMEESIHSVIVLRVLDMVCLVVIALLGLITLHEDFSIPFWPIVMGVILTSVIILILLIKLPEFTKRQLSLLRHAFLGKRGWLIIFLIFLSWFLEAGILYGIGLVLIKDMSYLQAVFANSITIAGQIFQITPGGIANYESFLVFALSLLGVSMKTGYTVAVLTHGMKFIFSYAAGAISMMIYPISWKTVLTMGKRRKEK